MEAVRSALEAWPALSATTVLYGTGGQVPQERTVEIVRGTEETDDLVHPRRGTVTLWLDSWVRDETDNLEVSAYPDLAALEGDVLAALMDWQRNGDRVAGCDFNVNVRRRQPDGGIFRPVHGSRTTVSIEWRKVE
ncbi:hypothetical protein H0Z60_10190 [Ectothiorhodospiraceae bacterium WFHF3C12]|nr:hypothetical protein [Ectothiorhodospiraceae bacterium WFHF3C12]